MTEHVGMMQALRVHFTQVWPRDGGKRALLADYLTLKGAPHLLADIAVRNYVFAPIPPAKSTYAAGVAEGRRQCALELIRLCGLEAAALWDVIESKPRPTDDRRM